MIADVALRKNYLAFMDDARRLILPARAGVAAGSKTAAYHPAFGVAADSRFHGLDNSHLNHHLRQILQDGNRQTAEIQLAGGDKFGQRIAHFFKGLHGGVFHLLAHTAEGFDVFVHTALQARPPIVITFALLLLHSGQGVQTFGLALLQHGQHIGRRAIPACRRNLLVPQPRQSQPLDFLPRFAD